MSKKIFPALILQILFFLCFTNSWGQTYIEYLYDDSGNRTDRQIVMSAKIADTSLVHKDSLITHNDSLMHNDSIHQPTLTAANNNVLFTEQVGEIKVSVFPNPTNGKLTLKVNSIQELTDAKYFIYTESGVLLTQSVFDNTEQVVDFTTFSVGNYILKIMFKDTNKTFKIVKTY